MKCLYLFLLVLLLSACQSTPEPIEFGFDTCHFCKMTIVDSQHASLLLSGKGKTYKYDAIECLVRDLYPWQQVEVKKLLVADYQHPNNWISATQAFYLITPAISSPMGANLSAFQSADERAIYNQDQKGTNLRWMELTSFLTQPETSDLPATK